MRIVDALPVTGADKIAKLPLRAAGWLPGDDEVWWRPERDAAYEVLDEHSTPMFGCALRRTRPDRAAADSRADLGFVTPRRFGITLAAIAFGALVIRIVFIVVVAPKVPALGDASAYHLLAEQLAHGGSYIRPFDNLLLHVRRPTAEYPPLFPVLLSLPARLGAHSVDQQRIFVAFVGAGTVTLVGLLGRRVASPTVGLVAAALAAVYPMLFLTEATLMAESLYVALATIVLLSAYRAYDDPTPLRFAALGIAIGCATLTRAEGILLGIVIVVPLGLFLARRSRPAPRSSRIAIALGVAVVVVAPWTIRNAVRFHTFVPVSNNVATLVDGANCDATYGGRSSASGARASRSVGDARPRALPQARRASRASTSPIRTSTKRKAASTHTARGRGVRAPSPRIAARRSRPCASAHVGSLRTERRRSSFESLEGRPTRVADARHRHVLGALALRDRGRGRTPAPAAPLVAARRDRGHGDDRRGRDLRPAALPHRGRARDPRSRGIGSPLWRRCGGPRTPGDAAAG